MNPEPDTTGQWLGTRREEILAAWRRLVLARLAPDAAGILATPDPFANPMGHRVHASTAALLDAIAAGQPEAAVAAAVEPLMRVQAIQGRPASEAVAFVSLLARASREVSGGMPPDLAAGLRDRLDAVLLVAFDVYVRCREEIFEIRVREARRRVSALIDRLAVPDEETGDAWAGPEGSAAR